MGADGTHTLDLPSGNLTTDCEIIRTAMLEERVVVTKDSDFVDSFLLKKEPAKLLFITTGNITNNALIQLVRANWTQITAMLGQGAYVELSRASVTLHM